MKTHKDCIPCFIRQAEEAVEQATEDPRQREEILRMVMATMSRVDLRESPPAIAAELHRIIRHQTGERDPYLKIKERMNRLALDALPACAEFVTTAADIHEAAVRIAVAGNLLDSGAKLQSPTENLLPLLASLRERPLSGDPEVLIEAACHAERILYIADNAGEIVFDRLLLNFLPIDKVTLAVRGYPVLNDALLADAEIAGFAGLVPVVDNGSDVPGTILEKCSKEFRTRFKEADLIISKGQGNYETLSEVPAPIFFLFTVKCPLVAQQIGEAPGTLIVKKSVHWKPHRRPARA